MPKTVGREEGSRDFQGGPGQPEECASPSAVVRVSSMDKVKTSVSRGISPSCEKRVAEWLPQMSETKGRNRTSGERERGALTHSDPCRDCSSINYNPLEEEMKRSPWGETPDLQTFSRIKLRKVRGKRPDKLRRAMLHHPGSWVNIIPRPPTLVRYEKGGGGFLHISSEPAWGGVSTVILRN